MTSPPPDPSNKPPPQDALDRPKTKEPSMPPGSAPIVSARKVAKAYEECASESPGAHAQPAASTGPRPSPPKPAAFGGQMAPPLPGVKPPPARTELRDFQPLALTAQASSAADPPARTAGPGTAAVKMGAEAPRGSDPGHGPCRVPPGPARLPAAGESATKAAAPAAKAPAATAQDRVPPGPAPRPAAGESAARAAAPAAKAPAATAQDRVPPGPARLPAVGESAARAAAPAAKPAEEAPQPPTLAPKPPKPEWKVLEPEDPNDPVPHTAGICRPLDARWDVVAGSVRGKLHAHKAMYRDDAFAADCVDGWHILAVSDGAGSAKLSRVGARATCDAAVSSMKTMLSGYKLSDDEGVKPPDRDLMQLRAFLTLAACAARDAIVKEVHSRNISDRDLYCTLLLCIHTTWKDNLDLLAAIQVGDGAIGVYTDDGACTLMGIADHGEYSSETVFMTSFKQLFELPYDRRVLFSLKRGVRCVGVMSDGVSDDFFPEDKRLIELFVGNPVAELRSADGGPVKGMMLGALRDESPEAALLDWLRYEKKGSSDDRTLMLMYRKDKP